MTRVRLHYWAGARAAAGVEQETFTTETVAAALDSAVVAHDDSRFARVLAGSTLLVDGSALHEQDRHRQLTTDTIVEVLPPFAGGRC